QLADFARSVRPKTEPGVVVFDTDRYVIRLIPTFPIPGPNSVSYVRCETDDVDGVVREVASTFAPHEVPYNWLLDPDVQPPAIDGEPAGSCWRTLMPPDGAIINTGAVRSLLRGRGVYRAMVARRLEMAREAGCGGLVVWGGRMSAPILEKLGFEKVSWRRFYVRA